MNEENNKHEEEKIEAIKNMFREMKEIAYFLNNAPRDNKGQVVVSVVGIKNFGMFYLFEN